MSVYSEYMCRVCFLYYFLFVRMCECGYWNFWFDWYNIFVCVYTCQCGFSGRSPQMWFRLDFLLFMKWTICCIKVCWNLWKWKCLVEIRGNWACTWLVQLLLFIYTKITLNIANIMHFCVLCPVIRKNAAKCYKGFETDTFMKSSVLNVNILEAQIMSAFHIYTNIC